MNAKTQINKLWDEMRGAINRAYATANKTNDQDGVCLRDYAENISWSDSTARLLGREAANERQHRSNRPSVPGFSVESAAKLILMNQAYRGANELELPRSTAFLVFRQTAVEAQVIGHLIRAELAQSWRDAISALDYSELMKGEN